MRNNEFSFFLFCGGNKSNTHLIMRRLFWTKMVAFAAVALFVVAISLSASAQKVDKATMMENKVKLAE